MDPITLIAAISAATPLLTALTKKIFKTDQVETDQAKITLHTLLPLSFGLALSILNAALTQPIGPGEPVHVNWLTAILTGLAGGAGGAYIRDFDKNILGVADAIQKLVTRKGESK